MPPLTFTFADVIRAAVEASLNNLWSSLPGIVQSFNDKTQTADVQPAVGAQFTNEKGEKVVELLPVVQSVPVMFPSGGGFSLMFNLKKGDPCLLVFASASTDRYIAEGGVIKDPGDGRRHHLGDAFCIPGGRSLKHALVGENSFGNGPGLNGTLWLGREQGPGVMVDVNAVNVGGLAATNSDHEIVIQSALDDFMIALDAAIQALTDAGAPGAPGVITLNALKTALSALNLLSGWKANTSKARAC